MVVGNVICKNGIHEILRCIESVYPLVDKIYIADSYSTDGTWELLNKYKEVYNLELFQNQYEDMEQQRNWLLEKTPKDCWVISIDQDEKLEADRGFIERIAIEEHEVPITIGIPFFNLSGDILHHSEDEIRVNVNKVFYNDKNLHFTGKYHSLITYNGDPHYIVIAPPNNWRVLHYAWLDPERLENISKEVKEGKRDYKEFEEGFNKNNIYKL